MTQHFLFCDFEWSYYMCMWFNEKREGDISWHFKDIEKSTTRG